jgi:predicted  nucleic acid-binding Zn-ribbon protein
MTTEDRIKNLETQIEALQTEQAGLNKQLAQAEIDRWQERIDDLEVQMHLGAMETNERVRGLVDQLEHRWGAAKAQLQSTSSAASEGAEAIRASLQKAFSEIRQAVLETTHKIAS